MRVDVSLLSSENGNKASFKDVLSNCLGLRTTGKVQKADDSDCNVCIFSFITISKYTSSLSSRIMRDVQKVWDG
jgi:hypothetical protein